MTPEEFNKKIAELNQPKWCEEISYKFHEHTLNYDHQPKGLFAIYDFVNQQIEAWEKVPGELPDAFETSRSFFLKFKERMESFVDRRFQIYEQDTEERLQMRWNEHVLNHLAHYKNSTIFLADLPETLFLLQVNSEFPDAFEGACDYIVEQTDIHNSKYESAYFTGLLIAYEYRMKGRSQLMDRNTAEETSIANIHGKLLQKLTDSSEHYVRFQADIQKQHNESIEKIDKQKKENAESYTNWFGGIQESFDNFTLESSNKIADLEKTYAEQLRLKKPAEYWKQRAETLHKKGMLAMYWLISIVICTCITLYCLLWLTPEGMVRSFFNGDAVAIKWSVIYVTFISFLAYVVRALHKVAFSAFHLSRDAEEREQLTHVYLALIKDSAVDEKDKHLILQSLFSRADTGLLKEESGPTMPGAIIEKAARR